MRYWILSGILMVGFLLQSVVSNYLSFGTANPISPDFMLTVVVSYGLLFGWQVGLGAGAIGGLLIDLIGHRYVGAHVLSLGVVGLIAGFAEEHVFKDNLLLAPTGVLTGSIINKLIIVLCQWLMGLPFPPWEFFRYTILPSAIYDMILGILAYRWIYKYYQYLRPDPRGTIVIRRH